MLFADLNVNFLLNVKFQTTDKISETKCEIHSVIKNTSWNNANDPN